MKTKTTEKIKVLIENMTQNDYRPQLHGITNQRSKKQTKQTFPEDLLASNKLLGDALCDLASSINTMALSTFKKLQGFKLKQAKIKVGLANEKNCPSLWDSI